MTETARKDVSPTEAARRLGIDRSTVVRWLQADLVAGWRTVGGHWRVPETEIERLLHSKH